MEDNMKTIETTGYKNEYVEREESKKKAKIKKEKSVKKALGLDFLDFCMLGVSVGIVVGIAFLIVGLV